MRGLEVRVEELTSLWQAAKDRSDFETAARLQYQELPKAKEDFEQAKQQLQEQEKNPRVSRSRSGSSGDRPCPFRLDRHSRRRNAG